MYKINCLSYNSNIEYIKLSTLRHSKQQEWNIVSILT